MLRTIAASLLDSRGDLETIVSHALLLLNACCLSAVAELLAVQDLQVGKTVHTGVSPQLRTELWMSVLLRKGQGSAAANDFRNMLAKVRQLQPQKAFARAHSLTYTCMCSP